MKFQELYQTSPIIPRRKKTISELSHLPKADLASCRIQVKPRPNYARVQCLIERIEVKRETDVLDSAYKNTRRWSMLLF